MWSLTILPSTMVFTVLKSSPMVLECSPEKESSTNRVIKHDLPVHFMNKGAMNQSTESALHLMMIEGIVEAKHSVAVPAPESPAKTILKVKSFCRPRTETVAFLITNRETIKSSNTSNGELACV